MDEIATKNNESEFLCYLQKPAGTLTYGFVK